MKQRNTGNMKNLAKLDQLDENIEAKHLSSTMKQKQEQEKPKESSEDDYQ